MATSIDELNEAVQRFRTPTNRSIPGLEARPASMADFEAASRAAPQGIGGPAQAAKKPGPIGRALGADVKPLAQGAARFAAKAGLYGAGIGAVADSLDTPTSAYEQRTGLQAGDNPFVDAGIRVLGVMQDIGNRVTLGGADRLGNYLSGSGWVRSRGNQIGEVGLPGTEVGGAPPLTPASKGIALPAPSGAGAGRGFVNPPLVNPNAPRPTGVKVDTTGKIVRDGNSYSGANVREGADMVDTSGRAIEPRGGIVFPAGAAGGNASAGGSGSVRDILLRESAINRNIADVQRGLDAYGPGVGGGGIAGIGSRTLSSDANQRFNETPSGSTTGRGRGGRMQQRTAEMEAQRQANAEDRALRREQIASSFAGQQLAANTSREVAAMNADRSIEAAGIGATASRDVARIGADARRSAAEQAALAQAGNAESRVAAAEARAQRYIPVSGGQQVIDINGLPTTVNVPSRVFDVQGGRFIDGPPAAGGQAARPSPEQARAQALDAVKRGADKAAVNERLKAAGLPAI